MGNSPSAGGEEILVRNGVIYTYNQLHSSLPDVGIDASLQAYSGLDSNAVLQRHSNQLQQFLEMNSGAYIRAAGDAIKGVTSIPNAVGIGALLISITLELALAGSKSPPQDTGGLLRRVFAEEKASEVRNLMDEYWKRYRTYLNDEKRLIEETRRLEQQLSVQLTRLRNSMLREGQMSSRSLKHWANGAAFHAQMVIHLARLQRGSSTPARNTIRVYQNDMKDLLSKYKEYRTSKHKQDMYIPQAIDLFYDRCPQSDRKKRQVASQYACMICDSETGKYSIILETEAVRLCGDISKYYVEHMLSVYEPLKKLENYFPELDRNLDTLVAQHNQFRLA